MSCPHAEREDYSSECTPHAPREDGHASRMSCPHAEREDYSSECTPHAPREDGHASRMSCPHAEREDYSSECSPHAPREDGHASRMSCPHAEREDYSSECSPHAPREDGHASRMSCPHAEREDYSSECTPHAPREDGHASRMSCPHAEREDYTEKSFSNRLKVAVDPRKHPRLHCRIRRTRFGQDGHAQREGSMRAQTSFWQGRRVLVTGCAGFFGAAVARELLARQAYVVGLFGTRQSSEILAAEQERNLFHAIHGRGEDSFRIHSAMAIHEISLVYHLPDPAEQTGFRSGAVADRMAEDRVLSTLLRAVALHDSRIPVIISSPSHQIRLKSTAANPLAPHGIARFGEVFGGSDFSTTRVVPRLLEGLVQARNLTVNASSTRDFVYVRDAARACLSIGEALEGGSGPLDVAFRTGWEFNDSEMAGIVNDVSAGRKPGVVLRETPWNSLGWKAETTLTEAVRETLEEYRASLRIRQNTVPSVEPTRKAA